MHHSRRALLGSGLAALGALPFLSRGLMGDALAGGALGPAKRLIVFFTPNEPVHPDHWKPEGISDGDALTSLRPMMESLEPHMQDILMLGEMEMHTRGAETHGAGHVGIGHMLTGRLVAPYGAGAPEFWASGVSVDQHIAQALGVDALTLGVRSGGANGNSRISYTGASQPVHPQTRPDQVFHSLFADFELPPSELAELRTRRLSVLDRVAGDLQGLSSRLPSEAAEKLDVHLTLVRELEQKLESDTALECDPGEGPGALDYEANENVPVATERQIDVMVQALSCGITDVASLQIGNSGAGNLTPLWTDSGLDYNTDCHTIVHDWANGPSQLERRLDLEALHFRQFAYLLDQLADVPEDGGTMLDNTLVLWTKNLGYGHNSSRMLHMLCGGASGSLQTGRYIERDGQGHNKLLTSVCNLMGVGDESFGDPQFGAGPLDLA